MTELVWITTAFLSGLIANRLYFPPLVGYLAAGYTLHAIQITPLPDLHRLADAGIELLLFSVGLKLKPSSLLRREVVCVGGLHLLLTAAISGLVFLWLDNKLTGGLVLGVSLAFSSTVLAIKVLEDNGEITSFHGRTVVSILILQDIAAIALLAYAEDRNLTPWAPALLLLPMARPLAHRLLSACRTTELKLLLGVMLAQAGGVLAESVGIAADIGSLLTGVMLANHRETDELANNLWSLKELFLVAFFLQIGLAELPGLEQVLRAMELLALLPAQGLMFFGLFVLAGLRARNAFVGALALMTYSEFALITTAAVVKAGLLTASWQPVISLAVAGSLAIAAPLNRFSHRLFSWSERLLTGFEKKSGHPDQLPVSLNTAEWLVIGMGRTGSSAYQALNGRLLQVFGLDSDPTALSQLMASGLRVAYGDAEDSELWRVLPLANINGVILTMPSFEVRCLAVEQLRKHGYSGHIGVIGNHDEEQRMFEQLGVDFVVQPLDVAGRLLADRMVGKR